MTSSESESRHVPQHEAPPIPTGLRTYVEAEDSSVVPPNDRIALAYTATWALQGSNLRPLDYESTALTD